MGLVEKRNLIAGLSPPIDHLLCTQMVDEFISCERRYIQRDWEPAELDGGQFCEIVARIYYHLDSETLNHNKDFGECINYLFDDTAKHKLIPRRDIIHIASVLKTIYKFRSQRGAVHISANYTPNHMDARLVIENVRWVMSETLRILWNKDRESVAKVIRELLQFDVPCIGVFEDILLVQRTDLSPEEEILVLLHFAGEAGFTRTELGKAARCSPSSITRSLQKLIAPDFRQVVILNAGKYRLTDLGSKRIREQLAEKLLLS